MRKAKPRARPLTLDAGALVALDRNDRSVSTQVRTALDAGVGVLLPAGVLAQVWRDGSRQARLARLLRDDRIEIVDLGEDAAKAAGELCGRTGTSDVIDASVVVCAREQRDATVLTSDPADIRSLDPQLDVQKV